MSIRGKFGPLEECRKQIRKVFSLVRHEKLHFLDGLLFCERLDFFEVREEFSFSWSNGLIAGLIV